MPQMYPTQWLIWTNLSLFMFFMLLTLSKDVYLENTNKKTKLMKTKSWKW